MAQVFVSLGLRSKITEHDHKLKTLSLIRNSFTLVIVILEHWHFSNRFRKAPIYKYGDDYFVRGAKLYPSACRFACVGLCRQKYFIIFLLCSRRKVVFCFWFNQMESDCAYNRKKRKPISLCVKCTHLHVIVPKYFTGHIILILFSQIENEV